MYFEGTYRKWLDNRASDLLSAFVAARKSRKVEELEQYTKEDKGDRTMNSENCGCKVEAKEGQVTQELHKAENAADRLVASIDELEKQLSEVLHSTEPTISCDKKDPERALVPLASRIRNHSRLLQDLGTRVEEMRDRLEIR